MKTLTTAQKLAIHEAFTRDLRLRVIMDNDAAKAILSDVDCDPSEALDYIIKLQGDAFYLLSRWDLYNGVDTSKNDK